ncbi:prolyl-tRNA synthetase associated domain-containing protein [Staphylococcus kloosii]|jgi:Ala-tRNA(Pro) deacylase|uniref:prolyl-tRNA synthetase associated domain-containing protein n=1 Tax=Staphylococcus kloosii TaxID=29384 RepID=UPI00189CD731|nr:prolyl-tRNA synthetase associated domain-containing protein [Staphylococcus kloosii]MBF7025531.1 prolyl-tRNA synthetase associated domain-containing protein [Staphylococcus kloosii]
MIFDKNVYNLLSNLDISFSKRDHEPVKTSLDVKSITPPILGMHCKNLFLRNNKGNSHFLVVIPDNKNLNLKELAKQIGSSSLSFASQKRLYKYLNVEPGSVNPFALIYDTEIHVTVVLDRDIFQSDIINFHPNTNTATLSLKTQDFKKYINSINNEVIYL